MNLDFSLVDVPAATSENIPSLRTMDIHRAVLAWLVTAKAPGMAIKVPTRIPRFKADVAAFWNRPIRNRGTVGPTKLLTPNETVIVECRRRREECWPDFTKSSDLLPRLRELKETRQNLQADIRVTEPDLRETATLFEEYSEWHYYRTQKSVYHDVHADIKKIETALYKGTRFEKIRNARMADVLYLAVPERMVHPYELADGWGLIWIAQDLTATVVSQAANNHGSPENHLHLVQNIAAAALGPLLFSQGVYRQEDGCRFLPKPRRRRPRTVDSRGVKREA